MRTILVTGLGRSGSTIIQKVLNSHPEIYISDESWHFLQAAQIYASRNPRALMGMSDRQYASCIFEYIKMLYSGVSGKAKVFGDKCPPAFSRIQDIETLANAGDHSLAIIWTLRHPFDQALSWIERFQKNSLAELGFYGVKPAAGQYQLQQVVELIFRVWQAQHITMREHQGYVAIYEKMTESPEHELEKLHNWLGLEFYSSQLENAFKDAVIGGDPKFNKTQEVHSASRFRFRKEPEHTRALLKNAAEKTGIAQYMEIHGYTDQF